MTTAFLGPRGTFSEDAALLRAEPDGLVAFSSFPALVSAVETGLAGEAVLPIENSLEGAVSTTLDLLIHETTLRIAGELALPVRHFLITAPGVKLADVRIVTEERARLLEQAFMGAGAGGVTIVPAESSATGSDELVIDPFPGANGSGDAPGNESGGVDPGGRSVG